MACFDKHTMQFFGRGGRTRTADPCVPNAVRYRTALRPGGNEYNANEAQSSSESAYKESAYLGVNFGNQIVQFFGQFTSL
jgi:hypothetical protein